MIKKTILIMIALIIAATLLVSCGDKDTDVQGDSAISETNAFIETTADGGVVEQDSDGNIITKDKSGNILAVKDSSGNSLDVEEYIASRITAENNEQNNDSADSGKSDSGKNKSKKTSSNGEGLEDSIPEVIEEVPADNDNMPQFDDI